MHCWWVTGHLYEQRTLIGVIAVTQACCQPLLQTSTEQWGLHVALSSAGCSALVLDQGTPV